MRRAFLLPFLALVLVAVGFALALGLREVRDDFGTLPSDSAPSAATPAPPRVQLKSESNVCQSSIHRPERGQPAAFPDIYTKRASSHGIMIVADAKVPDRALAIAASTLDRMFATNGLATPIAEQGAYVIVADRDQGILDLPEFACLERQVQQGFFTHVCGVADRADYPVATVNELDLLGDKAGPCRGLNILYHEIGHLVMGWALGPGDYFDVKFSYQDAMTAGKYRNLYASTNSNEYFADAVQAYFVSSDPAGKQDRAWLKSYDPTIYALVDQVFNE